MGEKKKTICSYDIETIARPLSDEVINELCKTGNLKDPAKIAAKQAEFRSKLGANPLTAMPCCGGWYASDDDCGYISMTDRSEEAAFLHDYWAKLGEFDVLVGFNCTSFDSRILTLRAMAHGTNIPFKFDRKKFSFTGNQIDTRMLLQDGDKMAVGKLDFFLDMAGLESKTEGIDGSMIQDYWNEGLHQDIGEYCLDDCKRTFELFNKIKRYFL